MRLFGWLRYILSFDVLIMLAALLTFFHVMRHQQGHSPVRAHGQETTDMSPTDGSILAPVATSMSELVQEMITRGSLPKGRQHLVKSRRRCRRVRWNKHEERCREIFQDIFHRPFPSVRPDFLINTITGEPLELDGYCEDIPTPIGRGLAFEYDGSQHSKFTPFFHKNPYQFAYQVKKDAIKSQICEKRRILLIRIPSFVAYHDLDRYIRQKLAQHKLVY